MSKDIEAALRHFGVTATLTSEYLKAVGRSSLTKVRSKIAKPSIGLCVGDVLYQIPYLDSKKYDVLCETEDGRQVYFYKHEIEEMS